MAASSTRSSPAPGSAVGKTVTATDLLRAGRRITPPDMVTRRLDDTTPEPRDAQTSDQLGVQAPELLDNQVSELLGRESLDVQPSRRLDAKTTDVARSTRQLVASDQKTYERVTTFFTADQRRWLKDTSRSLPVDGLSASDIVRLAVSRLRDDINGGLGLVEALSAQAYREAATHPGRRNRGLPPR